MWVVDARESEKSYVNWKYKRKIDFIDSRVNTFLINKVSLLLIKYAHSYDYCGIRNTMINKGMLGDNCLRCSEVEIQEHIV